MIKRFYKFEKGKQSKIVKDAILKAGSERKLSNLVKIPKGSISAIKLEKRNLSSKYAKKLCEFLNISVEEMGFSEALPDNWGQVKGGRNLISKKINTMTLFETIEKLKKSTSLRMISWHRDMKLHYPKEYYTWQYERFKKIGRGYAFTLTNRIKVRNSLEKEIGDFLCSNFPEFEYEPYLNIDGKVYFPDFRYKNVIIEATEWKHPKKEKIAYLNKKCLALVKVGYSVCFFIPEKYRKFYKLLTSPVTSKIPDLKNFIFASVA